MTKELNWAQANARELISVRGRIGRRQKHWRRFFNDADLPPAELKNERAIDPTLPDSRRPGVRFESSHDLKISFGGSLCSPIEIHYHFIGFNKIAFEEALALLRHVKFEKMTGVADFLDVALRQKFRVQNIHHKTFGNRVRFDKDVRIPAKKLIKVSFRT